MTDRNIFVRVVIAQLEGDEALVGLHPLMDDPERHIVVSGLTQPDGRTMIAPASKATSPDKR